jgi:hypothetical protein
VLSSLPGAETLPTKVANVRNCSASCASSRTCPPSPLAPLCRLLHRRKHCPQTGGAGGSRSSCGRATACHSSGCHSSVCHSSGCHPSACHYRGARRSCACGTDQRSVGCASSFHATRSALDIYCRALALDPSGLGAPVQLLRPALANRSQLPPRGLPFNWHGFR